MKEAIEVELGLQRLTPTDKVGTNAIAIATEGNANRDMNTREIAFVTGSEIEGTRDIAAMPIAGLLPDD